MYSVLEPCPRHTERCRTTWVARFSSVYRCLNMYSCRHIHAQKITGKIHMKNLHFRKGLEIGEEGGFCGFTQYVSIVKFSHMHMHTHTHTHTQIKKTI